MNCRIFLSPREAFDIWISDSPNVYQVKCGTQIFYGLYSCSTQILKCSSNVISNTLVEIINLSISTGVYPNKLKMAKIIPIFKTNDDTDPSNYKPISLLSNFNRIFEKLIFKRMESFIAQHNMLSPFQHGFRKTLSTQHAILDIVSTIQTNIIGQTPIFVWSFYWPKECFRHGRS